MKHTLFAALLTLFVMCSAGAQAQSVTMPTTFFPPSNHQNCNSLTKYLSWDGGASTECTDGQSIISNAFNCTQDGAQLVYEGGRYVCKSPGTIPTCSADQFLSYDGTSYTCKTTAANPTCSENQVLTNTGNGLACVDQSVSMPTCGEGEFLTFNGAAYQCATNQKLTIPSCATGEMLSKDANGGLTCIPIPIAPGTTAGWCSQGWGGWDPGGRADRTAIMEPAYYDDTLQSPVKTHPDLGSFKAKKGCSCREGWTRRETGGCDFGSCATSNASGFVMYYTCTKD